MNIQSQKIAIVTGANNGIGFETTVSMAEAMSAAEKSNKGGQQ